MAYNRTETWNALDIAPRGDFCVHVDAHNVNGPENSSYGLVFRSTAGDEHEHYAFRISDTQHFGVTARYEGKIQNLIRWRANSSIRPGHINRIIIVAQTTNYYFFINNSFVGSIDSDLLIRGQIGLSVYLERIHDRGLFRFCNLEVRTPSGQ